MKSEPMTKSDLANFAVVARGYFRGEWDESLWKLALPRIASLSKEVAHRALEEYAIQFGGSRARFIPSKFFALVQETQARLETTRAAEIRVAESTGRMLAQSETARAVEADWIERRREIEIANPLHVGEAVDYLRSLGWGNPPSDFSAWNRSWILAVSDLVTDRQCPTIREGDPPFISAREFYRRAGKAAPALFGTR